MTKRGMPGPQIGKKKLIYRAKMPDGSHRMKAYFAYTHLPPLETPTAYIYKDQQGGWQIAGISFKDDPALAHMQQVPAER